jgi:hypothetical protein
MSLRTGTSLILLFQVINKVTAFYGILALFTSFPLSGLQLSMYIYSMPVLVATLYLSGPVKTQSPWHCVAFAYLYTIDSIVNAVYTTLFGISWFYVLAALPDSAGTPGSATIEKTSGFANPQFNVSQVQIVATPKPGVSPMQDAIVVGSPSGAPAGTSAGFAEVMLNGSSAMSLFVITSFWLLRFYAVFVVLAYARVVLRHHVQVSSVNDFENIYNKASRWDQAPDPFSKGSPAGNGWKGKVGRLMVSIGRDYWLGRDTTTTTTGGQDVILKPITGTKYRKSEDPGTGERERRRRSGTGPPAVPPGLVSPTS